MFVGIGNGLTNPSSTAGALSVRPALAGSASGLSGALTVGAGAVLTSFTGAFMTEENAVYKLVHDARIRLRDALRRQGVTIDLILEVCGEGGER